LFDRARSSPDPRWRTIGGLVAEAAGRFAGREFLRFPGASLTVAGADVASNRLAHVLVAHGVRPGDRVAIMMGNVPDWPLSWFAIGKAGAITVPVNARYREADLSFVLADSGAVVVLAGDEQAGLVRAVAAAVGTVREVLTPAELAPRTGEGACYLSGGSAGAGWHRQLPVHLGHHRLPQGVHALA
jgi:acyl-CoA synthetase (AMP-forming)/AMP-acid ligase II